MHTTTFLTPRSQVVSIPQDATLREALEVVAESGHAAIPVLDEQTRYVKTLTEGDLLRTLMERSNQGADTADALRVADIAPRRLVRALDIDSDVVELLAVATEQNFVPIIDSRGVFAGIVRRRAVLEFCTLLVRGEIARQLARVK
jgi:CBS domain-containing protein